MTDLYVKFLILFGVFLGLLMSFFFLSRSKSQTGLWISMLMLSAAIELLNYSLIPLLKDYFPGLIVGFPGLFLIPPFLFLYLRSFRLPNRKFTSKDLILFLPFGVDFAYRTGKLCWVYVFDLAGEELFLGTGRTVIRQIEFLIYQASIILYLAGLSYYSWQKLYQQTSLFSTGSKTGRNLKFILYSSILLLPVWAGYEVVEIVQFPKPLPLLAYTPLHFALICQIAILAFISLEVRTVTQESKEKYNSYQIPAAKRKAMADQIKEAIEDKRLYLDPELKLSCLSESTHIPSHHLSQVFSVEFNTTFKGLYQRLASKRNKNTH